MAQGDFAFILHDSRTRQVSLLEATTHHQALWTCMLVDCMKCLQYHLFLLSVSIECSCFN